MPGGRAAPGRTSPWPHVWRWGGRVVPCKAVGLQHTAVARACARLCRSCSQPRTPHPPCPTPHVPAVLRAAHDLRLLRHAAPHGDGGGPVGRWRASAAGVGQRRAMQVQLMAPRGCLFVCVCVCVCSSARTWRTHLGRGRDQATTRRHRPRVVRACVCVCARVCVWVAKPGAAVCEAANTKLPCARNAPHHNRFGTRLDTRRQLAEVHVLPTNQNTIY